MYSGGFGFRGGGVIYPVPRQSLQYDASTLHCNPLSGIYIYIYICERGLWGLFGHNTLIHLIHLILQPSRPELNELNELIS